MSTPRVKTFIITSLAALTLSACASTGTPDPTLTDPPMPDSSTSATPAMPEETATPDSDATTPEAEATGPAPAGPTAPAGPADKTTAPEPEESKEPNPAATSGNSDHRWTPTDELMASENATAVKKNVDRVIVNTKGEITVHSTLERTKTKDTVLTPARQDAVDICEAATATFRTDADTPVRVVVLDKNGDMTANNTPKNHSYDICSWV